MQLSKPTLKSHLAFTILSALILLLMFSLLRLALLIHNHDQIGTTSLSVVTEAFFNGVRFDVRVVVVACIPLVFAILSRRAMAARLMYRWWLIGFASITLFLGIVELDFYQSFNQRLNSLVFQYFKEDPATVVSMVWYGFPVARYLLAWLVGTLVLVQIFKYADILTRPELTNASLSTRFFTHQWYWRLLVFIVFLAVFIVAARGTLRQGPPLRWGDAFTTESMFVNELGLNGTLTLYEAAKTMLSDQRQKLWKSSLPDVQAQAIVRKMLLTPDDQLIDSDIAAVRRDFNPPVNNALQIKNVVVILMESFSGQYVGALGNGDNITPNFDKLSRQGLLFNRFFSNGTHTHQGMFATMACFPNLPGFEYLMQTPEGQNKFSGLPQLLSARAFDNLYVYNGDFAWDNQAGFFGNQGMSNFIGRKDYVNPVFSDPTWGVSDQDMFDRGAVELAKKDTAKPFYALLQTLSNHTPYALPKDLPVERVTGHGSLDEHLTAMRYSDWALGQFFEKARQSPYFKNTLFVVVGDHGFGSNIHLTEMDLYRFHVPLLFIAPGIHEKFGATNNVVGTQVDIVPTIMGRLGGNVRHQCWGRDLLNLPVGDHGEGVIKPSGNDQTVAIIRDHYVLVKAKGVDARLYDYQLGKDAMVKHIDDEARSKEMLLNLEGFLQTATKSLLDNTAGVNDSHDE